MPTINDKVSRARRDARIIFYRDVYLSSRPLVVFRGETRFSLSTRESGTASGVNGTQSHDYQYQE